MSEASDTSYTFAIQAIGAEATQKALADTKAAEAALVKSSKELGAAQTQAMAATAQAHKALELAMIAGNAQMPKTAAGGHQAAGALKAMSREAGAGEINLGKLRGSMGMLGVQAQSMGGALGGAFQGVVSIWAMGGPLALGVAAVGAGLGEVAERYAAVRAAADAAGRRAVEAQADLNRELDLTIGKLAEEARAKGIENKGQSVDIADAARTEAAAMELAASRAVKMAAAKELATRVEAGFGMALGLVTEKLGLQGTLYAKVMSDTLDLTVKKTKALLQTETEHTKFVEIAAKEREKISALEMEKAIERAKKHVVDMEAAIRGEISMHEKLDATEEALLQKEVARIKYADELRWQSLGAELKRREQWKAMQAESLAAGAARGNAAGEKQQGRNDALMGSFDTGALDSLLAATGKTGDEIEKLKQGFMDLGSVGVMNFGAIAAAAEAGAVVAGAALGALSQAVQESLTENRYAAELAVQGYEDRLASSDADIEQYQKERDAARETIATTKDAATKKEAIAARDTAIAAIKKRELELRSKAEKLTAQDTKAAENERVAAVLAGLAVEAGTRALMEFALGVAAAATPGMQASAAGHFAAATLLGGVAGVAGATASSMSANRSMSGQERLQFEEGHQARRERAEGRAAEGEQRRKEAAGRAAASESSGPTVIVNVVGPYMTGEAVGEAVDKALKAYEGVR